MKWITFTDAGDLSFLQIFHRFLIDTVKRYDHDLAVSDIRSDLPAGRLNRFDRADGFVIVLTVNDVDVVELVEERSHDFFTTCLGKFTVLLRKKIPSVFLDRVI